MSVDTVRTTLKGNYNFNPVDGKVTIDPKASNNPDQVLAIRVDYEDGIIQQSEIYYIRVFVPMASDVQFNDGINVYMMDRTLDLYGLAINKPHSAFEFVSGTNMKIDANGILTLVYDDTTATSAYSIIRLRQRYNGGYLKVGNTSGYITLDKSIDIYRRYITTLAHLAQLDGVEHDAAREGAEEGAAYRTYNLLSDILWVGTGSSSKIAKFDGILMGNRHTLTYDIQNNGLSSNMSIGLFGELGTHGEIRDLTVVSKVDLRVDHGNYVSNVGGLVGVNYGIIDNATIHGSINVDRTQSYLGGIVGINYGTVSWSVNQATIRGSGDMGGHSRTEQVRYGKRRQGYSR